MPECEIRCRRLQSCGFEKRGWRRLASILVLLGTSLGAGCCSSPDATHYFDLALDPIETLRQFQYGVETYQESAAYVTLSERSREKINSFQFWYFLRHGTLEGFEDVSPREFVVGAVFDSESLQYDVDGDRARINLLFDDEELGLSGEQMFYFRRIDGVWVIDIIDIIESLG